jgi:predicted AAA+ superfamily ATPase
MDARSSHLDRLRLRLADFPVVALLGPRQVGKTTLARQLAASWDGPVTLFDLEDPEHLARLARIFHESRSAESP